MIYYTYENFHDLCYLMFASVLMAGISTFKQTDSVSGQTERQIDKQLDKLIYTV